MSKITNLILYLLQFYDFEHSHKTNIEEFRKNKILKKIERKLSYSLYLYILKFRKEN